MIRHICMFKLIEENKENNINEFFKRAENLRKLDVIKGFSTVRNSEDTPDSNYDVALIFDFDNTGDLDFYQKSPEHIEFGDFICKIRTSRACIDYNLTTNK